MHLSTLTRIKNIFNWLFIFACQWLTVKSSCSAALIIQSTFSIIVLKLLNRYPYKPYPWPGNSGLIPAKYHFLIISLSLYLSLQFWKNTNLSVFCKSIFSYVEANFGNSDLLKVSEVLCVKEEIWRSSP